MRSAASRCSSAASNYDPGFGVPPHVHEHTEQVMVVTEGELELTVAGQGTRTLGVGDWAVINRGVEHSVRTEDGAQFIEALAPVPLDHVPDRERDLVLGPDGGSSHVAKVTRPRDSPSDMADRAR